MRWSRCIESTSDTRPARSKYDFGKAWFSLEKAVHHRGHRVHRGKTTRWPIQDSHPLGGQPNEPKVPFSVSSVPSVVSPTAVFRFIWLAPLFHHAPRWLQAGRHARSSVSPRFIRFVARVQVRFHRRHKMQRSLRLSQPSISSRLLRVSLNLKQAAQPRRSGLNSATTLLKLRPRILEHFENLPCRPLCAVRGDSQFRNLVPCQAVARKLPCRWPRHRTPGLVDREFETLRQKPADQTKNPSVGDPLRQFLAIGKPSIRRSWFTRSKNFSKSMSTTKWRPSATCCLAANTARCALLPGRNP